MQIVRLRRHAVLDFVTLGIVHGDHVAAYRRDWRAATSEGDIGEVTNTERTAADRAVRKTGVVCLNRFLTCVSEL